MDSLHPTPNTGSEPIVSPPPAPEKLWLHVFLFLLTFLATTLPFSSSNPGESPLEAMLLGPLRDPVRLLAGLRFSLPLMSILLAHESGHYLTARRYGVNQSLPYFIPAPGTYFGTMGAVIVMRSTPPNRPALLNVAVMGPYAGVLLAIPAAAWGLAHSPPIAPETLTGTSIVFGSSLLFQTLEYLFSPNGTDVLLHPVGLAGWVGLLITSLNLIPVGQLDGGHVSYALTGRYHIFISRIVIVLLIALSLYLGKDGLLWIFWAFILSLFGLRHPPVERPTVPLSGPQRLNACASMILFALTFTPVPLKIVSSDEFRSLAPLEKTSPERHSAHIEEFPSKL